MIRILVVDDEKYTRGLMKAVLESEKYTVLLASDGSAALELLSQEQVDLAIVDIMMPKMDGYELAEELRKGYELLPILMVSAKKMPESRKKGYLVGIDDYMTKPVDMEELLLHIRALLRRAKIASERRMAIGEIVLDYDEMSVTWKGEKQTLPQKEFLLLYKLLSYPDRVFTRIQLMDEIWGADSDSGLETITVHVNRLRKRFESCPEFELVNVRGLGYKAARKR
jgi:Response regulators consisting of a CheY-like receiver domain and a winged-helix DNA-binding domain